MAEDDQKQPNDSAKNSLILEIQKRLPIETSQGTFYVRHICIGDVEVFNSVCGGYKDKSTVDMLTLGEFTIKSLVSPDATSEKDIPLNDDVFKAFTDSDIPLLITGVAKAADLPNLSEKSTLQDLGSEVFDYFVSIIESSKALVEKMRASISSSFGMLPKSTLNSLTETMLELNAARENLKNFYPSAAATLKTQDFLSKNNVLRNAEELAQLSKPVFSRTPPSPQINFPSVEETPLWRAAVASEDSASHLHSVSDTVGVMAEKLTDFHTLVLTEVIPEWYKSLKANSDAMQKSLLAAAVALIISVIMTGWQIYVERDSKVNFDIQQNKTFALMREQLIVSQELNKQLELDSKIYKQELTEIRQYLEAIKATQVSNKTENVEQPD